MYSGPAFPGTAVKVGSRGNEVKQVQERLNSAFGHDLKTDGIFGAGTAQIVKEFQKSHKDPQDGSSLTEDGIIGAKTWRALFG